MATTPQDVQAKLNAATLALSKTTKSYPQMVKQYGADSTKWPASSQWYIALNNISLAYAEVGHLTTPVLTAEFSYKES